MKSPKQCAGAEFIPSFHAAFSRLSSPNFPDPDFLAGTPGIRNPFVQGVVSSTGAHCVPWGSPATRRQEKTQNSGRQEISIRYLLIAPEDTKEQRKIDINSR